MTHEEALDKAFEDGKSRGYEEGLSAGRAEGKELGKEEGRTEGMAEGKIEGGNEAEARLSAQVSALEKLITNTINSETLDAGYLRNLLGQKIAELASERAGSEIAIAPEGFSEKIEKLLDTVSHATETPLIFLNGTDYQSVAHLLIARDSLKKPLYKSTQPYSQEICGFKSGISVWKTDWLSASVCHQLRPNPKPKRS